MEVLTDNGFKKFDGLKISENVNKIKISFSDGNYLTCTPEHLIKMDGDLFIRADNLQIGDKTSVGAYIEDIQSFQNEEKVYDLVNVEYTHSYITNDVVSHNCLYLDECAFIEPNQWEEFWASTFPVISSSKNSRVVMVTTPNGCNYFYDMWMAAQEGKSPFKTIKFTWEVVPTRDKEWEENMRGALGESQFQQEFNCSFAFSEYALVPGSIIDRCLAEKDKPLYENNGLTVFHEPQEHHQYFMSCDVANMGADYSTFILFDITSYPYIEVCSFRANLSYILFAPVIASISQKYNNAVVLVESNDIGQALIHALNNEYEVELAMSRATLDDGRPHSRIMFRQGQRTTPKSKLGGCLLLKTYLENRKIKVSNINFYTELRKFVRNNTGSYSAEEDGVHDDSVMCTVNFCWYINSKIFKTTYDRTLSEEMRKSFDEELEETYGLPLPQRYDDENEVEEKRNQYGYIIPTKKEDIDWLMS